MDASSTVDSWSVMCFCNTQAGTGVSHGPDESSVCSRLFKHFRGLPASHHPEKFPIQLSRMWSGGVSRLPTHVPDRS